MKKISMFFITMLLFMSCELAAETPAEYEGYWKGEVDTIESSGVSTDIYMFVSFSNGTFEYGQRKDLSGDQENVTTMLEVNGYDTSSNTAIHGWKGSYIVENDVIYITLTSYTGFENAGYVDIKESPGYIDGSENQEFTYVVDGNTLTLTTPNGSSTYTK